MSRIGVLLKRNSLYSSWPGLTRPSTSFFARRGADARDKPRHDGACSCLRPRQIQDALGDDAEHHLGRAAFDRIGLGAQPGARASAFARALALPFQRVDAASRHQDLVAALVELGA